jgi:hypothetical protein
MEQRREYRGPASLVRVGRWGLACWLALALGLAALPATAEEYPAKGRPALPGGPCGTPPHPSWNEAEKWAWGEICRGKMADFNKRFASPGAEAQPLPPDREEAWTEEERARRGLSGTFIETVLLHEPWRGSLGRHGVKIQGAHFAEPVDLTSAEISHELWLEHSRFEKGFSADYVNMSRTLSLEGSSLAEVSVAFSNITGLLAISGKAQVRQSLAMKNLQVGGTLYLDGGRFQKASLTLARIGGWLSMVGTVMDGPLDINAIQVGGVIQLNEGQFRETILHGVRVAGLFTMEGAVFPDKSQRIDLKDTQVGAVICNDLDTWPENLELDRFTYQYLGGMGGVKDREHMTDWPASRFVGWLAKQKDYSPQPYEQCAKVLRDAGQPDKADYVLFAGKQRERQDAWDKGNHHRWLWLSILRWTIGYGLGLRFFLSLIWVACLVLLGGWVVSTTPLTQEHSKKWMLGYSLAKLLPLVNLGKNFDAVVHGWQQGYFMFHQLVGWALASFIVAGLSGLTK